MRQLTEAASKVIEAFKDDWDSDGYDERLQDAMTDLENLVTANANTKTSTESLHTPGPWEVRVKGVNDGTNGARFGAPGTFVGQVKGGLVAQCVTNQANKQPQECLAEGQANARLIAAAPELLEALRDAESLIDECEPVVLGLDETAHRHRMTRAAIRAAIAKATGAATA